MKTPEPVGQQGRWLDLLGEYDITIQHRPGRVHGNSDALSRHPCESDEGLDCRQCSKATSTLASVPISCDALSAEGSTALPTPLRFHPRYSQSAGSPDLLLHTGHADTTSSLLDSPDCLASPLSAPDSPLFDDVTAQASILSVSAEVPSLTLEGIRDAQANDESIQPVFNAFVRRAGLAMVVCNCLLSNMAIANRLLLATTVRLSQLFVHAKCDVDNASLIGRCANVLASSPKVNSYAAVSVVVRGNCGRLLGALIVQCAILFDLSLLRIYLFASDSLPVVSMSDVPESIVSTDPKPPRVAMLSLTPVGATCTRGHVTQSPPLGGSRCYPTPMRGHTRPRPRQTHVRRSPCPCPSDGYQRTATAGGRG